MTVYLKMFAGLFGVLGLFVGVIVTYLSWPIFDASATGLEALAVIERQIVNVTIHADGSSEEIEEYTKFIRSRTVVSSASQVDINFNSTLQKVEVLEAYTILPSGKQIPVEKNQIRIVEDDISEGTTMFSDSKHLIVIYPNVSAGARIFYKIKTTSQPIFEKNFESTFYFYPGWEYGHFEYNIRYDPKLPIYFDVKGLKEVSNAKVTRLSSEDSSKGLQGYVERRFTFAQAQVQQIENAQISYTDFAPHIHFSSFKNMVELGKALNKKTRPKSQVTPEIQKLADELTKGEVDP